MYWILWFSISLAGGHTLHFPVDVDASDRYTTLSACESAIPAMERAVREQFPDDPAVDVYCEPFTPDTKGI